MMPARKLPAAAGLLAVSALALGCVTGCRGHLAAEPSRPHVAPARPGTSAGSGPGAAASRPATARQHTGWPARTVVPETQRELAARQVADPGAGAVYALVPRPGAAGRGRYQLRRIALATGTVRRGRSFAADGVTLASGYLWIYRGPDQRPGGRPAPLVVRQVSPRALTVVRSVTLAPRGPVTYVPVAAGPAGSVWIGGARTAWRVSTATGAVLARATVPAGFAVRDVAVGPGRRYLYVSALNGSAQGGPGAVFEYDAVAGRPIAAAEHGPVTFAVAGADLTATPYGVWASYRTGMLGATILLRRRGLATVLPPGYGRGPRQPLGGIYQWPMDGGTAYGGGALFLANFSGVLACASPRTGRVRARTRTPQGPLGGYELLAVSRSEHLFYAVAPAGVAVISPPARCWG